MIAFDDDARKVLQNTGAGRSVQKFGKIIQLEKFLDFASDALGAEQACLDAHKVINCTSLQEGNLQNEGCRNSKPGTVDHPVL